MRFGTLDTSITEPTELKLIGGGGIVLEPLVRKRGRLTLKGFDPCTILLNNDLSAGTPPQLMGLHEQYLLPPLHAGWTVRRKSQHFRAYEEVAKRFGKLLGMDPWLITPMFASVDLHAVELANFNLLMTDHQFGERPYRSVGSIGRTIADITIRRHRAQFVFNIWERVRVLHAPLLIQGGHRLSARDLAARCRYLTIRN